MKIVDSGKERFPNWFLNEFYPAEDTGENYDLGRVAGGNASGEFKNISCSKGKIVNKLEIKVLKSGNYTVKVKCSGCIDILGEQITGYTFTETIK